MKKIFLGFVAVLSSVILASCGTKSSSASSSSSTASSSSVAQSASSSSQAAKTLQTFKFKAAPLSIQLEEGWETIEQLEEAELELTHSSTGSYLGFVAFSRTDIAASLNDISKQVFTASFSEYNIQNVESVEKTIGSYKVVTASSGLTQDGLNLKLQLYMVETSDYYIYIVGTALASQEASLTTAVETAVSSIAQSQ